VLFACWRLLWVLRRRFGFILLAVLMRLTRGSTCHLQFFCDGTVRPTMRHGGDALGYVRLRCCWICRRGLSHFADESCASGAYVAGEDASGDGCDLWVPSSQVQGGTQCIIQSVVDAGLGPPDAGVRCGVPSVLVEAGPRAAVDALGCQTLLQSGGRSLLRCNGSGEVRSLEEPACIDDLAILLSGGVPDVVLSNAVIIVERFDAICQRYGFRLNMIKGKTECLARWRGVGATQMREFLELRVVDGASLVDTALGSSLRVVHEYRHLGVLVTGRASQRKVVGARCHAARIATVALGHSILANERLPRATRVYVANACCQGRLLRLVGTRERLAQEGRQRLYVEFTRPHRITLGCGRRVRLGEYINDIRVRSALGIAHPEAWLIADRLRLVAWLACSAVQARGSATTEAGLGPSLIRQGSCFSFAVGGPVDAGLGPSVGVQVVSRAGSATTIDAGLGPSGVVFAELEPYGGGALHATFATSVPLVAGLSPSVTGPPT
jgi:hypothetical protein